MNTCEDAKDETMQKLTADDPATRSVGFSPRANFNLPIVG